MSAFCTNSPTHICTRRKLTIYASCLENDTQTHCQKIVELALPQPSKRAQKDVQTEQWKWVISLWYRRITAEINKYNCVLSELSHCLSAQM